MDEHAAFTSVNTANAHDNISNSVGNGNAHMIHAPWAPFNACQAHQAAWATSNAHHTKAQLATCVPFNAHQGATSYMRSF